MVAVRMVSEGVDVPRLAVGVYATSASTPLYFAQAIGRFVRARRPGETASVFLPSVPPLLRLAGELEAVRDHVLGRRRSPTDGARAGTTTCWPRRQAQRDEPGEDEQGVHRARRVRAAGSGDLRRGVVRHRGDAGHRRGGGLPRAARAAGAGSGGACCCGRGRPSRSRCRSGLPAPGRAGRPGRHRTSAAPRSASSSTRWSRRTTTAPAGRTARIHNELRRACGGPPTAVCSVEQLEQRIATLQSW